MRALTAFLIVVMVVFGGAAWVFSDEIRTGVLEVSEFEFVPEVRVVATGPGLVTLENRNVGETQLDRAEVAGLAWDGGYGRVTSLLEGEQPGITRGFEIDEGSSPLREGDLVAIDEYAFSGDPLAARGVPFSEVSIQGPLGDLPAWVIRSRVDSPWVVLVHGRSDRGRAEFLRIIPALRDAGYNVLVPTYRNDDGAPAPTDGRVRFGSTEWEDLAAAVDWVQEQGEGNINLVGYGMGGSIVLRWMLESPDAGGVSAVFLDSPVINVGRTIELQAAARDLPIPGASVKVPSVLAKLAILIGELRFDVAFSDMDYLVRARDLPDVPILVAHGTDDVTVPIETSRAFADVATRARLIELPGVAHVRGWNVDPAGYEQMLIDFLDRYQ